MNKEELRALYKQIRLRMSQSEVSTKSRMINRRLINEVDWAEIKKVCAYQPVAGLNEVDISGFISRLKQQADISVQLTDPRKNAAAPKLQFDMIIVPCLAFDSDGYRLGWGGGWYDKFLAAQPMARKIGVCFQSGSAQRLPLEPHDIRLDTVITEV